MMGGLHCSITWLLRLGLAAFGATALASAQESALIPKFLCIEAELGGDFTTANYGMALILEPNQDGPVEVSQYYLSNARNPMVTDETDFLVSVYSDVGGILGVEPARMSPEEIVQQLEATEPSWRIEGVTGSRSRKAYRLFFDTGFVVWDYLHVEISDFLDHKRDLWISLACYEPFFANASEH